MSRRRPPGTGCRRRRAESTACRPDGRPCARLPPHSVPDARESGGAVESAVHFVGVCVEQPEAMVERERRRRLRAEIAGRRRPCERHHPRACQRRQLERGEVAVAQPALARAGQRGEVEARQQARPAVAAAQRDRELDARIRRHAQHRREPLVVGRGEALPARAARRVDDHAMAHRRRAARPRASTPPGRARSPPARRGRCRCGRTWVQRLARRRTPTAAGRTRRRARRASPSRGG